MVNEAPVTVNLPSENGNQKITFHQGKPIGLPLNGIDPELAAQVQKAQLLIAPYERAIHQWVASSSENAQLFAENPLHAIQVANVGIPADVLKEIQTTSDLLLSSLKK